MIAGFLSPDSGDIRIGGKPMNGVPPNRRPVNMVFQHLALFPMMSVGENVGYGLARRGVAPDEIKRRVGEMLERVSLPGAQNKRVEQLSGGQKQRVAIARSLVLEPTLLLLDEPLGALDLKLREHMKIELKQLQAAFGTTFVYITHDQSEALVLSDHVAVMNHGRFEQVGTPQALYYQPDTPFVAGFVGANNRVKGRATAVNGDLVTVTGDDGMVLTTRSSGKVQTGDQVEAFVRPKSPAWHATPRCFPTPACRITGRRWTACCLTAPTRPCSCMKRSRAQSFALHCPKPATCLTCGWEKP